jgi:N-acetylglucosaminyl-diphospho-decaprenol L-rhamnosyltransferase
MAVAERLPVYLIHYDQPVWCGSASASLLASTGVEVEITVVDNGQQGGPRLRDCVPDEVRIIRLDGNRGYTGGANAALADWRDRHPSSQLCVIGSHDLHVEPETLARLVSTAEHRVDCGIIAPALVEPEPAAGGFWTGRLPRQFPPDGTSETVECDWASGTCLLLRRACVDAVGPFDERLGSYVEDVDYGLRAGDEGWNVLVTTRARASGRGSGSSDSWGLRAANTVLLNAKRNGARAGIESFAHFALRALRGHIGSVLPWRDQEQREFSGSVARGRTRALVRLSLDGRLVAMLRDHAARKPTVPAGRDDAA